MFRFFAVFSLIVMLSMNVACAQDPSSPVNPVNPDGVNGGFGAGAKGGLGIKALEAFTMQALHFQGFDVFGEPCDLYIGKTPRIDGETQWAVHVDYSFHSLSPQDILLKPYFFNIAAETKYSLEPTNGSSPSLVGISLADPLLDGDPNKLLEYVGKAETDEDFLLQSLRVDLNASDFSEFNEAFEHVLEDPNHISSEMSRLNVIDSINMLFFNNDHSHHEPAICKFNDANPAVGLQGLVVTNVDLTDRLEFDGNVGGGHEDHDDDHDHDSHDEHEDHDHDNHDDHDDHEGHDHASADSAFDPLANL